MPVATTKVHFGGHCGRSAVALPQKGRSQNVTPPLASSSRPTALIRNTHRIFFLRLQWPGNQMTASLISSQAPCRPCMAVSGRRVKRNIHLSVTRCCFSHHRSWRGFCIAQRSLEKAIFLRSERLRCYMAAATTGTSASSFPIPTGFSKFFSELLRTKCYLYR